MINFLGKGLGGGEGRGERGKARQSVDVCTASIILYRYDIMLTCWSENPKERPTFTDLRKQFERMLYETDTPYINFNPLNTDHDEETMATVPPPQSFHSAHIWDEQHQHHGGSVQGQGLVEVASGNSSAESDVGHPESAEVVGSIPTIAAFEKQNMLSHSVSNDYLT